MSIITDTWRGLVQRRLWPLALLLVAALVAVPVFLAKDPAPAPAPSPAAAAAADAAELATTPIVAEASAAERERVRHVVGRKVNPFQPAPVPKAKKPKEAKADKAAGSTPKGAPATTVAVTKTGGSFGGGIDPIPSAGGFGGGTLPSGGVTIPGPPTVTTPKAPKQTFPLYSLKVRWGAAESETLEATRLERLKALPSNEEPVVIYLGVLEDEETAVFMVDASATPEGDGRCRPTKEDCQTVHLREGETAFFDVAGADGMIVAQYQLDLVDIHKSKTASAKKAAAARVAEAKGGRKLLRKRLAQAARYGYDKRDGLLEKLPVETVKAKLARIAEAAGI